ncbi:pyruvate kinase [Marinimicrobium sp. ABcell2]|uniref:pyruvate kinase n=1 Tax=Marinimicrobium sp. ABcell2 TaxID=3069751 RepID=UPI0027B12277|nr:pyruvate kinase [Marinimicrobium sp. ABcell2]MDQ2077187.1 pyruvate kinase [Marinimicrobium sp. ABcell2]
MLRRTKIVSTLGPASESPEILEKLILAGVNVVRLNFSHGSPDDHRQRAELVREIAKKHGLYVAVLGDLQGPKIRISRFAKGKIHLALGDKFVLDASLERDAGDQHQVGIDYKELPQDCQTGDMLLLDDGRVVLEVEAIDGPRISCITRIAGPLSNNKGINRQGGGLSAPALTEKDMADIKTAADIGVDYLAVSFPRSADDMNRARELMRAAGGEKAGLVSKIERAEAVADDETLDGIINASDAVMVARGDLGVEIGDAALIGVQKHIIARSRALNKVVITATQMMESMISSPMPTRAEVFDVANAVLDGTDAVMLSGETAAGDFPVETVEAMVRIIRGAEQHPTASESSYRLNEKFGSINESIAFAAMYTANHLGGVKAIIALTESGTTPRLMSRVGSELPIFAFSQHVDTQRRVALYRGVQPVPFETATVPGPADYRRAMEDLKSAGFLEDGDLVIVSNGDGNQLGGTNTLKILRMGDKEA